MLCGIGVLLSCSGQTPPNIVLIVMDTVRQDHLSCYGYDIDTSPNLSDLAKASTLFFNAYSTSCWTAPAHASMFTGLFPVAHGSTQENPDLQLELVTLAEALSERGYQTFGITENGVLHRRSNFGQGFSEYYETWAMEEEATGDNLSHMLFKKILRGRNRRRPFFMFVNLIEAHAPYEPPDEYYARLSGGRAPQASCSGETWCDHFLGRIIHSEEELDCMRAHYDAEILQVDHIVGSMMKELQALGEWERTIFVVTSDHGENLGDHDMLFHVFNLYETNTKIPLIIHYPKFFQPGAKDYRIVQLVDLYPTFLSIAGIEQESFRSHGISLLPRMDPTERSIVCEYYYPAQALLAFDAKDRNHEQLEPFKRRIRSITRNGMKLIVGSDGRDELYDLSRDPLEQDNLIDQPAYAESCHILNRELSSAIVFYECDAVPILQSTSEPLDEATREQLELLGYLD